MPVITLKDGTEKQFDHALSVLDVAFSISESLARVALAGSVNGVLVDLSFQIETDAQLAIITDRDEEGLDVIRHSTAHLLAHAVKELYPETQITIGPVIEDGFYYDFARETRFSLEDFPKIEAKMKEIATRNYEVTREVWSQDEAVRFFEAAGENYKAQIVKDLPDTETITVYKQGGFLDLCRGPHISNTGKLKAFKLTKLAGAYWRGDSNNEMLQRIYGTAWSNKKALDDYLHRLEEAEKRDHRKLAKKMDLFHLQEEAPGMVFWHANGWQLYRTLQDYIRTVCYEGSYQEIQTPQMLDQSLWEKSGHLAKFGDEMFKVQAEDRAYAIKPMSCPCHVETFKQGLKSYRDLPLRLAEFGSCHRNEPSGTLHGLMRARNFTQDDGHIFCTKEQIEAETSHFITQVLQVYQGLGFARENIIIHLSTRPAERVGSDEIWDVAEQSLENILNKMSLDWTLQEGEGAFYGPKIDFSLRDCLHRVWQCGTMQLDFSMPERLGAHYIAEDGSKQTPVMLHRAILGSLERFLGILVEQYAGNLPLWLAPRQVVVLNMSDEQVKYSKKIADMLKKQGLKVFLDLRNEKIGFKIREHTIARVPYLLVIGKKEEEANSASVRLQNGESLGSVPLDALIARLKKESETSLANYTH